MNNIEELKKAALKATQGEWWQDVVETKGTYGVGDDCSEGFHSYAVYGPDCRSLLDMTNSTAAIIHTEDDGDYLMAWDETGRRNAKYIALANPAAILDLIAQLEAAQKELSAANEKLKGDQVPVGFTSERALAEVYCGESSRFGPLDDVGDIPLYDRPQKPVVLSSSTVMSRAYVVRTIKAAGFKVEGE
ncbi:ead/Ea22-like family protein [Yersinia enterocolitica]|uniref:ead/Ea22-like family protein n=1 Tax=Yersinia enterocolitica TaxID=630 RepID=UPI003F42C3BF